MRGIAILMVMVFHYVTLHAETVPEGSLFLKLYKPTRAFWSGVDLFFVLSGFLIGGILIDHHAKANFLKVFWIRRCCRILPVLGVLLFSCWASRLFLNAQQFGWLFENLMPWWTYLTFTQNIAMGFHGDLGGNYLAVTWSLAVEEQFYLCAPLMILLMGRSIWTRSLLPLFLLALVLRIAFPGFHTFANTPFRMDSLLAGAAVAVVYRNQNRWESLRSQRYLFLISLGLLVVILGYLSITDNLGVLKFTWFAILYALFITVVLMYQGTLLTMPLRMRLLTFWGMISYGMYMYHQAIHGLLHGFVRGDATPSLADWTGVGVMAMAFIASTIVASLSFRFLERPILEWGRDHQFESIPNTESCLMPGRQSTI